MGKGKGKEEESSSCCSPHNISRGGGLRRREAYELRSRATRTRSGLIRVRKASPPSKIPNRRHAPKNQGDSRRQVPPRPEQMEKQNKESESLSNPPAPPSPVPNPKRFPHSRQRDNLVFPKQNICRSVFPEVVFPEPANLDEFLSFRRGMDRVLNHLSYGGTDVERIKREVGVTDETLRKHRFPANMEEYRQSIRRAASPYIQACFAKLNETTNQDDDLELLDVLFIYAEIPYGSVLRHMHFRASGKSKAESPGLYCAVFFPLTENECHVIGCVLLPNDCPGDSQGRNSGKCLHFPGNSANTIEEALEYASGGCHKALREDVGGPKYCYEIGEISPHDDSAREIPVESSWEMFQIGYNGFIQPAEGELDRERVGTRKGKEGDSCWEAFQKGLSGFKQRAEGELDRERVGKRKGKEVFCFRPSPCPR